MNQKEGLTLVEENKLLKRRIKALDSLCICYRCTSRPSEKLFTELERTERMLKKYE